MTSAYLLISLFFVDYHFVCFVIKMSHILQPHYVYNCRLRQTNLLIPRYWLVLLVPYFIVHKMNFKMFFTFLENVVSNLIRSLLRSYVTFYYSYYLTSTRSVLATWSHLRALWLLFSIFSSNKESFETLSVFCYAFKCCSFRCAYFTYR